MSTNAAVVLLIAVLAIAITVLMLAQIWLTFDKERREHETVLGRMELDAWLEIAHNPPTRNRPVPPMPNLVSRRRVEIVPEEPEEAT